MLVDFQVTFTETSEETRKRKLTRLDDKSTEHLHRQRPTDGRTGEIDAG